MRTARFRLEWDSGIALPVRDLHGSPTFAPQAGHSTCCDFGMIQVYADLSGAMALSFT